MNTIATAFLIALAGSLTAACSTARQPDPATAYGNQLGAISYQVKRGDNLVLIAADITHERENWRRIALFNRIDNPASLRVGQTLFIPRDLIPLNQSQRQSRPVAGHPEAVVNAVKPTPSISSAPLQE